MARFKIDFSAEAFRKVLGFTFAHWRKQPGRAAWVASCFFTATAAEVLTPFYAGQLVDALVTTGVTERVLSYAALAAFSALIALGFVAVVARQFSYVGLTHLTLKMMTETAADAFHRVQRFSSDWHANAFAGSTVRKITRGVWALDLLNDTIIIAFFPSLVMLIGSTIVLSLFWPVMGLVVGIGSVIYVASTVILSTAWVAPAGALANSWDTRLGGALADAVSCNAVVKGFGAEDREETRLSHVLNKWEHRNKRTWLRGTLNGTIQGTLMLLLRGGLIGAGLLLWQQGAAQPGDIAFVITTFFVLQGYLRDIGMHVRNLQRSVNDMEELVALYDQPLGIEDKPDAKPMTIRDGGIRFESVDFHYGHHTNPLYHGLTVDIRPGERVGLVGHSGSGKTTFVKLIQRLYDVTGGRIAIDGVDIRDMRRPASGGRSPLCSRSRCYSTAHWPTTSPMAAPARSWPKSLRRRSWPMRMTSSRNCRAAMKRWWANAASSYRAASGSAWPLPAPSSPIRGF